MARFVYGLQNILVIKEKLENQQKTAFSMANARANEEAAKLKELYVREKGYQDELKKLMSGDINISDIRMCKNAIAAMKSKIRDQMIVLSKAQKQVEIERNKLNEAMQDRKMHENLREKAFQQFLEDENKAESLVTDELVSFRHTLKEEE